MEGTSGRFHRGPCSLDHTYPPIYLVDIGCVFMSKSSKTLKTLYFGRRKIKFFKVFEDFEDFDKIFQQKTADGLEVTAGFSRPIWLKKLMAGCYREQVVRHTYWTIRGRKNCQNLN